jgi:hypothetical protein
MLSFVNPNNPVNAGIQKNMERIKSVAPGTEYSPFVQKKVEAVISAGAAFSEKPCMSFSVFATTAA